MIDIGKVKSYKAIDLTKLFERDDYLVTRYADSDTITSMMDCFLEVIKHCPAEDYYDFEPVWTHEGIGCAVRRYGQTLIYPPPSDSFDYSDVNLFNLKGGD